jgi:peptide/nickel transport system substrate-binding protein
MTLANLTRRHLLDGGSLLLSAAAITPFTPAQRAAAAGKPTETLTVGTNIPFTTLDPNTINTSVFPFRNSVFDGLIQIPVMDIPTYKLGSIQNELASAVNVNADYTEIRMRVRDGVKFHDGAPMTVGDVVESIRYALDTKTGGTMAGSLADIASLCFACSRRGILPTTPTRRWEPDRSASASMCPMTT